MKFHKRIVPPGRKRMVRKAIRKDMKGKTGAGEILFLGVFAFLATPQIVTIHLTEVNIQG
jgi:hypothetical protein